MKGSHKDRCTQPVLCLTIFTHRTLEEVSPSSIQLCDVGEAATITLSYVSVKRGSYRSGNPLWSGSILPPSCSCSRANRSAPHPPLRSCLRPRSIFSALGGLGPFLCGMSAEEPVEWKDKRTNCVRCQNVYNKVNIRQTVV